MNSEVKFTFSQTHLSEENLSQALLATLTTRNAHISTRVLCPPTVPGQAGEEPGVLRHWAGTSYLSNETQLQFFLWRQSLSFSRPPWTKKWTPFKCEQWSDFKWKVIKNKDWQKCTVTWSKRASPKYWLVSLGVTTRKGEKNKKAGWQDDKWMPGVDRGGKINDREENKQDQNRGMIQGWWCGLCQGWRQNSAVCGDQWHSFSFLA